MNFYIFGFGISALANSVEEARAVLLAEEALKPIHQMVRETKPDVISKPKPVIEWRSNKTLSASMKESKGR